MAITANQAKYFGLDSGKQSSPVMTKIALVISANTSYQKGEKELEMFTGIKMSDSTLQRLVKSQEFEMPTSKQGVQEITIDGGKIRLRTENIGTPCTWKDYKAINLDGVYTGAFFQDNLGLIDWSNSQKLVNPLFCLGDGHPGIWNLFAEVGNKEQRVEILDWYHLRENLYKVGGSRPRLKQAETLLWTGKVLEVIALFKGLKRKQYARFINYLLTHRSRIINYQYYQEEGISSIGSGTVESMVKQIGARVKISGAQWNIENVPSILAVRCAYLNNQLTI